MRKLLSCLLVLVILAFAFFLIGDQQFKFVNAEIKYETTLLRAGGGGGGSGGGGGGGSGGSGGGHASGHTGATGQEGERSIFGDILFYFVFVFVAFGTSIIFGIKISKSARNSKKLMKMLQNKDGAWKYKNIYSQVKQTYHIVQKCWTNMDMTPAKSYMSQELYENFNTKLNWMAYKNQRNVLKMIRLIDAQPVSVYDDVDDKLDHVWFYIEGSMIDYTVDSFTNAKISGNIYPESFVEYWQFTRESNRRWVLNKILQKDQEDQIAFSE